MEPTYRSEEKAIEQFTIRLNAVMTGIVIGILCGTILFLATIFLVLKGGPNPGYHLRLLAQYFPGYSVTIGGSFLGFLYGGLVGFICGWFIGSVYNRFAR
jgi:hypothetical protein